LVVVAKILQKIGSVESLHTLSDEERKSIENDSNHLNLIDRVIKKYNLLWKNYFHRLLTGDDISNERQIAEGVFAEELIDTSNMDLPDDQRQKNREILEKQIETVQKVLSIERASEGWKAQKLSKNDHLLFFKKMTGVSSHIMSKSIVDINVPFDKVHHFVAENFFTEGIHPGLINPRVVEKYSNNLSVIYCPFKIAVINDRDLLMLRYHEILEEDGFGITCLVSIEREDVPHMKGYVRSELFGGLIVRRTGDNTSRLTYVYLGDGKGMLKHVPDYFTKAGIKDGSICVVRAKETLEKMFPQT